jgi:iron complex outermembrane recepter protein
MKKSTTLLLCLALIIKHLSAQKDLPMDSSFKIKEVIIHFDADKTTPITFQNIGATTLKTKSTGQEPAFILAETPSITAYSDAGNTQGYAYFRLRGIDQTRINMTFDGVPMNEPEDQGAYFSNYPDIFNSVSKIQIQRGVGTSKNGVASFGGSVQLFSPNLTDSTKTTFGLGFGSFNSLRAFGEYNSGLKNRKALYIRASKIYSDGYKYHSTNNSQSIYLSSGLFLTKSIWKINLLAGQQKNDLAWLGVSDSLILKDRRTNANAAEKDNFTQILTQVQNKWQINRHSSLQTSVYYTFLKGNYDFDFNNFLGFPSTNELYNYAFQSNLLGFFSNYTYSHKKINWTTGIHANQYERQHLGSEKSLGQLYVNTGFKKELSAFTKADYTFGKLNLFADIQARFTSFDYEGAVAFEKQQWRFINPKIGLSYAIKSNAFLYYSVGNTGREPTRNDLFGGNDDLLADSLGNAILSIKTPEYVVDHELGYRNQTENSSFNLNFYYMDFKNEIVLDGKFGPNGLALTNKVAKSFRAGIEVSVSNKLSKNITFNNSYAYNYSRIKEQNESFSPILTPKIIYNQEAVYALKNISIALSARYQSQSFLDYGNTTTIKKYTVLNTRFQYDIKKFQISLWVNNLRNAKYFNNGYIDFDGSTKLFVQAPRNFYAALKYSF